MKKYTLLNLLASLLLTEATTLHSNAAVTIPVGQTDNWNINITIDGDWNGIVNAAKSVQKGVQHAWDHVFGGDPEEQQVFSINGKKVVLVRVIGPRDTRITSNINFDPAWRQNTLVRVLVAGLSAGTDPAAMQFQQKYDEDWGSDPNIGPIMKHGDVVDFNPGHGRYMAKRSGTVFTGAILVFAEASVTPAELAQIPGLAVLKF